MTKKRNGEPKWKTTWLWTTLESRSKKKNDGAAQFLGAVEGWMKKIDKVLSMGGTSPNDFTLHDSEHSFRVAERMAELMPPSIRKNISDYEIALLILSAYSHDLGMTPTRSKVQSHYTYLFDPDHSALTPAEVKNFQKFLDDYDDRPVVVPLCASSPTTDDLNFADELTAFYVRDQHNNWSAEWIRESLDGDFFGLTNWKETLVRLCQSHHFGFEELKGTDYDPRPVGSPSQIVHLRFLACLLRLADILENDPERTPEIIFRHRGIEDRKRSVVHWQKDHDLTLDLQGNRILFHARPRTARIHKALLQLADWIDDELHGIAQLGEKLPPVYKIGDTRVIREWTLASATVRDIEAAPRTYEYIEGAFRPNTARLLQLLSGDQLYHQPLAGVRELIQNAFDAVREKIARRRLQPHVENPADISLEERYGNEELVTLVLQDRTFFDKGREESQLWLVCEDSGVGLTKALITGHLLVSGQSRRHDISELERRCERAGFPLERTGQFGIGVLSYFMLASEVHITTTRFQDCGDLDAAGWTFTTRGVGDFGELRRLNESLGGTSGTKVEWRIRTEKCGDPKDFEQQLFKYLTETLVRLPCAFRYKTDGLKPTERIWEKKTGWTTSAGEAITHTSARWRAPNELDTTPDRLLSEAEIERENQTLQNYPKWLELARASLKCELSEILLPDGLGIARLILPFFDLPKGRSLAFLFEDSHGHIRRIRTNNGHSALFRIASKKTISWKGIATTLSNEYSLNRAHRISLHDGGPCGITIDFFRIDNSALHVSRDGVILPDSSAQRIADFINQQIQIFTDEVLSPSKARTYHLLNSTIRSKPIVLSTESGWPINSRDGMLFEQLSFPLIVIDAASIRRVTDSNGSTIRVLARNGLKSDTDSSPIWPHPPTIKALTIKSRYGDYQFGVPFWSSPTQELNTSKKTDFPPEWSSLFCLELPTNQFCINLAHPLSKLLNLPQIKDLQCSKARTHNIPWDDIETANSRDDATWSLSRLAIAVTDFSARDEWEKYQLNHPDKVRRLWSLAFDGISTSPEDLRLFTQGEDILISLSSEKIGKRYLRFSLGAQKNLLPPVTDTAWILQADSEQKSDL